jgi:hypothetical protein
VGDVVGKSISKRKIQLLALLTLPLGLVYFILGIIAIVNWVLSISGTEEMLISPEYIPGDLGLSLILLTVGLSLVIAIYYLGKSLTTCLGTIVLGLGLAVGAMAMQVLIVGMSWLDGIIVEESLTTEDIVHGLLRVDALMGYIALPLFLYSLKTLKKAEII